ncbi:MAG: PUR family DNA/RNA-binding protein [Chitinophagales bacterium]|nr:PUR family DNA/RNA-binding protein [Chitinophagales bacterium]MDW8419688.1 DUF3276 family protein [Chitinophagales bacterium]
MENNQGSKYSGYYSRRLKAGKRRTYFFDVRSTRQNDYFLTITESKKKFDSDGYESHKIFLYKEDFKKFLEALNEAINYIKTELMPDYDYDSERPARGNDERDSAPRKKQPPRSESPDVGNTPETGKPAISDDEEVDWN